MLEFVVTSSSWGVPRQGFAWVDGVHCESGRKERCLVIANHQDTVKTIFPMEDTPGLFKTFAALEPTEERIAAFAGVNGFLHSHEEEYEIPGTGKIEAEPLSFWISAHSEIRSVVNMLDAAASESETLHEKLNEVSPIPFWGKPVGKRGSMLMVAGDVTWGQTLRDSMEVWPPRHMIEQIQAARIWAATVINDHLVRMTTGLLTFSAEGRLDLQIVTPTPLCSMWLQLAMRLAERGDELKECETCGELFAVAHNAKSRGTRRFCSARCRSRQFQVRHGTALEMAASGIPPGKIARALETDTKTVKGWIKQEKQRPGARRAKRE